MVGPAGLPATSAALLLDKNLATDVLKELLNYDYVIEASLSDELEIVIAEVKEDNLILNKRGFLPVLKLTK